MDPTLIDRALPPGSLLSSEQAHLLPPCAPRTFVAELECNSRDLLAEHHLGCSYPMLTLLPGTVIGSPDGVVRPPAWSTRLVVNAELAFVCAHDVAGPEEVTAEAVLGYTMMISMADWSLVDRLTDPTARDLSMNEDYGRWFDGYKPLGPWLVTPDEMPSIADVEVVLHAAGRSLTMRGADLIYQPLDILTRLASHLPFSAGDVVGLGVTSMGIEMKRPSSLATVEVRATCDLIGDLVCTLEFPGGPAPTGRPEVVPRAAAAQGEQPGH